GLGDDLDVGLGVEDQAQPGADDALVIGDQDADGHVVAACRGRVAVTAQPPSGRGPASKVPPSSRARSAMPMSPKPVAVAVDDAAPWPSSTTLRWMSSSPPSTRTATSDACRAWRR